MGIPPRQYWTSIDPGHDFMGYAHWVGDRLDDYGLLTSKDLQGATHWTHVAAFMAHRAHRGAVQHGAVHVVCELPQEMGGAKGEAALRSGSVRKLTYLVGLLGGMCRAGGVDFQPVEPMQWKGQVPKAVTLRRVARHFPSVGLGDLRHDVVDAIGIGLWRVKRGHTS